MTTDNRERTGGCLCGSVRYRLAGALRPVVYCHCTQCRRQTGHYLAATAVLKPDFQLTSSGDLRWYAASPEARRGFCGKCGSILFWEPVGGKHISLTPGTLDDDAGLVGHSHIYLKSKGHYYEIADGLPQYAVDASLPAPGSPP